MSDSESTPNPRRSQRERKQAKQFLSGKRKRGSDASDDDDINGQQSAAPLLDGDEEEEEEYHAPKPKAVSRPRKKPSDADGPIAKKTQALKSIAPKRVVKRPRKPKGKDGATDAFDATDIAKETKIANDNALFNAIMNPAAALQSTVEDFLESLANSPGPALAELINCILRACGCNDSVDLDTVVDYDGVIDALDNFTEGLKQEDSPIYPLTSKLTIFKKFRKSLTEFLERLVASSAELGSLYASDLMLTLQTWVVAMSSSHLRSFRHTATVVALEVETALCDVAAAVEKEAEVVGRQREGERKRKAGNKSGAAAGRSKELEGKAAEIRDRRTKLAEYLKEFVDGVFVHRYRDLDPNIRAECVQAMGRWYKKYPAHFLDGTYLRYVGWVLSDANTHVRLEAVRALAQAYDKSEHIGSLSHFTERFKPRLVEMAQRDTELSVRVAVIQVLGAIDGHGLLDDEQREQLCLLVYDAEAKVRKAVSGFVRGVWEEAVDERLVGKKAGKTDRERAGVKALGMLLVSWGKALDKAEHEGDDDDDNDSQGSTSWRPTKLKEAALRASPEQKGRIALAVEALREEIDPVGDWEAILDLLLLDHSANDSGPAIGKGKKSKGQDAADEGVVDDAWRLDEVEESVLLEVLVAALRKARADVVGAKKGEDETVVSDITRTLIKALPRLFVKYQTDPNRIANVLLIPRLMNLDMYLEMRMIAAYSTLWDDVSKQFLSHSSLSVLTQAVATVVYMMDATSLSNTNSTKILELEDELSTSLRDVVAGRDELEMATFTEDEVLSLAAVCARLDTLMGTRNMSGWMEEDEGGKQSSAWDIMCALVERGRLGYKEEEKMIDSALHLLALHIMWKARGLSVDGAPSADDLRRLQEQRDLLLEKVIEYAVGTQSNTVEGVRRAAFQSLMDLHIFFSAAHTVAADGSPLPMTSLAITLDDEAQYRCAGFIQAEIERFAEAIDDGQPEDEDKDGSDSESGDDAQAVAENGKAKKGGKAAKSADRPPSRSRLEEEYVFIDVVSSFLRAIRARVIHIRHGAIVLAHYGRLGLTFNVCAKLVVDVLREEGIYNDNGAVVAEVVVQAVRESFLLLLDGYVRTEEHSVALSKLLVSCLVARGAHLSIIWRLDSHHLVEIQTTLLSWISKRIATYESNKNKKARKNAILLFKALAPLLSNIEARDALTIKAHMEQVLAQAKVEVSATSKVWEVQRTYEKRLTNAMSREKGTQGKKAKAKGAKSAAQVTTDEETDEGDADALHATPPPPPRPGRKVGTKSPAPLDDLHSQDGHQSDASMPDQENGLNGKNLAATRTPVKPRPRPRQKQTPRSRTANGPDSAPSSPDRPRPGDDGQSEPEDEIAVTPKASRKRGREDEEDGQAGENDRAEDAEQSTPASPAGSDVSHFSEIVIKRKRARR